MPNKRPRSAAQIAAYQRLRPQTEFFELERSVDLALVGRRLRHRRLGVVLAYSHTLRSEHGQAYAGTVVEAGLLHVQVGGEWAYWAERWEVIG